MSGAGRGSDFRISVPFDDSKGTRVIKLFSRVCSNPSSVFATQVCEVSDHLGRCQGLVQPELCPGPMRNLCVERSNSLMASQLHAVT